MILASQSPRRIELMREAGYACTVKPADIDETPHPGEHPLALVERLARSKAQAVASEMAAPGELVIAADTIVTIDGEILGKPRDTEDAKRMLRLLSGRTHQVATGVCIATGELRKTEPPASGPQDAHEGTPPAGIIDSFVAVTDVSFYPLSEAHIEAYVASGEPMDKAGAYGIQGAGGRILVRGIRGDYYNVVGLPIAELARHLGPHITLP